MGVFIARPQELASSGSCYCGRSFTDGAAASVCLFRCLHGEQTSSVHDPLNKK